MLRGLSVKGGGALEQKKKGLEHLFANNGVTQTVEIGEARAITRNAPPGQMLRTNLPSIC